MKVKELIEQLQKLDPEKNVWIFYDYPFACMEPELRECSEEEAGMFTEEGCQPKDYVLCDAN